jgi:hypothetical protein
MGKITIRTTTNRYTQNIEKKIRYEQLRLRHQRTGKIAQSRPSPMRKSFSSKRINMKVPMSKA